MKDNTASIWNLTLANFRRRASNRHPSPAGGSVAIVACVLGCSLLSMALKISVPKEKAGSHLRRACRSLEKLMERLSNYADADLRLFRSYLAAQRMARPSTTSPEIDAASGIQVAKAARSATAILLKAAEDAVSALKLAENVVEITASVVISDVQAGSAILHGSVRALLCEIRNNLAELEPAAARSFGAKCNRIEREADVLWDRVSTLIEHLGNGPQALNTLTHGFQDHH